MPRKGKLLLLTSVLASAAAPSHALAQTSDSEANADIVVTATRVSQDADDSSISVTSVGDQQLSGFGRTSIGDQLSELPALRETETQQNSGVFGGGGVTGANFLDLRGLGITRTLVLENGRRHVASQPGSAAVDINLIPLDLIRRVDVVTGGISAIYGSDAVSGVINFVLDDQFTGLRARAQSGISSRGDAAGSLAALTFGRHSQMVEAVLLRQSTMKIAIRCSTLIAVSRASAVAISPTPPTLATVPNDRTAFRTSYCSATRASSTVPPAAPWSTRRSTSSRSSQTASCVSPPMARSTRPT